MKIYTKKKCDLSLQNESDSHQVFDLKSTNVKPLTYGNLEAGSNTTTELHCNIEMDNLNIAENATVIQSGKVTTQHLETKQGSRLNIRGEFNLGKPNNIQNNQ